jgi:hypothetical protein
MGIGAALYIHHLEKVNYIKINKIAGCSIGSLIAVWYICDCPDNLYPSIDTLFADYKKNKNFFVYEQVVRHSVSQLFPEDADIGRLNGILYINYYDTKKCKQRVISKFKHREHLITCILRSSHVPFLTSASHKYQGRYVDGISPHIFNEGKHKQSKNLFIQLINFTDITKTLNIKREKNIYSRLIRGVVDTNEFFINDSSPMCSYVGIQIKIQLFIREYFVFFILSLMDCIICLKSHIPPAFRDTFLYNKVCVMCKQLWEHFLDSLT